MIRDGQAQQRRLLRQFGYGFGFFNMGFIPFLVVLSASELLVLCVITTSSMVASPPILRITGSLHLSSNVLIGATIGLFGGASALMGGLHAPTLPVLIVAPLLAVFLLGRPSGMFWGGVVVALSAAFFGFFQLGVKLPVTVPGWSIPVFRVIGMVTVVGVTLAFFLLYDDTKNQVLAALRRSNQRMIEMIKHLDDTSAALSRSTAELVGAEISPLAVDQDEQSPGLTQQMLSTAVSSRAMIGAVGTSIRGMIGQYKDISSRIHELHQQAGTIVELVDAIDTISDRLDLMALNTGIEASHAGAHGKQFQLLADDMRRLAERVVVETNRIKALIRAVQKHTQGAIDASMRGQALTDEGSLQLESMSRAFDDMHELIERAAEASGRITADTIAQLATIHSLVSESLRGQNV